MSDYNERACWNCGSYLHHEDNCPEKELDNYDTDEFERCSQCDGHPACEDFGCAHLLGLSHLVKNEDSID